MMTLFPDMNAFIKVIEETSKKYGGGHISRLWLKAGPGMCFSEDTSDYMEAILKGTVARGAEIYISHGAVAVRCRCCGLVYGNENQENCPECGGMIERISLSRSFIIDRVELHNI